MVRNGVRACFDVFSLVWSTSGTKERSDSTLFLLFSSPSGSLSWNGVRGYSNSSSRGGDSTWTIRDVSGSKTEVKLTLLSLDSLLTESSCYKDFYGCSTVLYKSWDYTGVVSSLGLTGGVDTFSLFSMFTLNYKCRVLGLKFSASICLLFPFPCCDDCAFTC